MSTNSDKNHPLIHTSRKQLTEKMQWLGQMASTETALFHQAAAAKLGLGITDMKAVSVLTQEGTLSASQLAKRLNLTMGATTSVVDRLGKIDAVHRATDPKDRRKVLLTVNGDKIADGNRIYASMGMAFEKLYQSYTQEQLAFLVDYYTVSIEITKSEMAKLKKTSSL